MSKDNLLEENLYSWDEIKEIINNDKLLPNVASFDGVLRVIDTMPMDERIKPLAVYAKDMILDNPSFVYDMESTYRDSESAQSVSLAEYMFDRIYHENYVPDIQEARSNDGFSNPAPLADVINKVVENIPRNNSNSVFINGVNSILFKEDKKHPNCKYLLIPFDDNRNGILRITNKQILGDDSSSPYKNVVLTADRNYSVYKNKSVISMTGMDILNNFTEAKNRYYANNYMEDKRIYITHNRLTPELRKSFYGEMMNDLNEHGMTMAEYDRCIIPIINEFGIVDLDNPNTVKMISDMSKTNPNFTVDLVKDVELGARESYFMTPRESGWVFNPQEAVVDGCEITEDNFDKVPASLPQFDISPEWEKDNYKELEFYLNERLGESNNRALTDNGIYLNDVVNLSDDVDLDY